MHPIQGIMTTAMENLKQMVNVNTMISDPIHSPDGNIILTVSKVSYGFAAGGSEFGNVEEGSDYPFGGGSGGGVSLSPIAFLIITKTGIKLLHLDEQTHLLDKVIDATPQAVERIKQLFQKNEEQPTDSEEIV